MKKVRVLIPFHSEVTGKDHVPDDIIELTDEQIEAVRAVNVNMVLVLGDAEEKPKTKAKKPKTSK